MLYGARLAGGGTFLSAGGLRVGPKLGEGKVAEVFEAGDGVLKLYRPGIGPEPARSEAYNLERLARLPLTVPQVRGVVEVDGRWGLLMSRASGAPLARRLGEPGGPAAVVEQAIGLHRRIHQQPGAGFAPLKARLTGQIEAASLLSGADRDELLGVLATLPDGDRLCHGDFHPFNVMMEGESLTIIDWLDASCGPPAADVARSYLLAGHSLPALGKLYLDAYLGASHLQRQAVLAWLPVLAGARLSENVPEEETRLLALARQVGQTRS